MVKEAYCSFKVAKLLKEKGFNEPIRCWYDNYGDFHNEGVIMRNEDCLPPTVMCPTHQLAMAWLRNKGYSIEVYSTAIGWHWQICKVNGTSIAFADVLPAKGKNEGGAWDDYDECTEDALKYCLENLI